jgi:aminocarboxymuconate-semialdehyde decarboxylase
MFFHLAPLCLVAYKHKTSMSEIVFREDGGGETNVESIPLKIDVHTHIIPENIPSFKERFGYGGFIHLDYQGCSACNRARMMRDDGTFFREIESNCWEPSVRLAECNQHNINVQVISTIPVMFSYWAKPEDCLEVCKFLNVHIADVVKENPKRFVGLGSIPMQDVDLAIQELHHIKALGLKGVQIGTNVNQLNLHEPRFLPIFAKCEELNLCLFIHPWDMMGESDMRKYWLPWLVGMPAETSRAICSFIFAGLFDKFPKLRVCFAHAGGSFPGTYGRIAHGYDCRPDLCAVDNPIHPKTYIGKFWVDSLAHDVETLDFIVNFFGAEKVALGSDYPFPLGEAIPGKLINSMKHWDEAKKNQVLYKSALAWLDMSEGEFL